MTFTSSRQVLDDIYFKSPGVFRPWNEYFHPQNDKSDIYHFVRRPTVRSYVCQAVLLLTIHVLFSITCNSGWKVPNTEMLIVAVKRMQGLTSSGKKMSIAAADETKKKIQEDVYLTSTAPSYHLALWKTIPETWNIRLHYYYIFIGLRVSILQCIAK